MKLTEILKKSDKIALVACIILMALFTTLGIWQSQRLLWKQSLIGNLQQKLTNSPIELEAFTRNYQIDNNIDILATRYSEQGGEFTPVTLRGKFLPHIFFLLNRSKQSKAGVNWLQIYQDEGTGKNILLNRGWLPFELKDAPKPDLPNPSHIEIMIRLPRGQAPFIPDNLPDNNLWFYIDTQQKGQLSDLRLEKYYGLVKENPEGFDYPSAYQWNFDIPNNHLQYMLTWFAFALITLVMGVYYQWRYVIDRNITD